MANGAGNSQPSGTWPEVKSGPLIVGGSLIGIGVAVAAVGLAVAGSHVVSATRQWLNSLETPPSQFAQLKWEQAKTAAASGANTWREHPNSKAHGWGKGWGAVAAGQPCLTRPCQGPQMEVGQGRGAILHMTHRPGCNLQALLRAALVGVLAWQAGPARSGPRNC